MARDIGEANRFLNSAANHVANELAQNGPRALSSAVPSGGLVATKSPVEIVKDFERPDQDYIA